MREKEIDTWDGGKGTWGGRERGWVLFLYGGVHKNGYGRGVLLGEKIGYQVVRLGKSFGVLPGMAPGVYRVDNCSWLEILAAWSLVIGKTMKYNMMIGTSMACPHVTGIVAFIKVVHPSSSPSAVNSAIMTMGSTRSLYLVILRESVNVWNLQQWWVSSMIVLESMTIHFEVATIWVDQLGGSIWVDFRNGKWAGPTGL
nr:subtilisin-like protease SBT3.9 [Tanacetum cinerariifolium]